MESKKCSCCGEEKSVEEFRTQRQNRTRKDGTPYVESIKHNQCKTCTNAKAIKRYRENPEVGKAQLENTKKRWRENPEWRKARLESSRKRYAENTEHIRQQQKEYRRKNMKRINALSAARKHRLKSLPEHREEISYIYEDAAAIGWHVDHIVPISKGGKHEPSNLQIVSSDYNLRKGTKNFNYTERQV